MGTELAILVVLVGVVAWLFLYMRAQKPATSAQTLIHQHRYEEAVTAAAGDAMSRGEALELLGRFDDAIKAYRASSDPAAAEAIALCLAHSGQDLAEARRLMEQTIALHPQILEFQALGLAYILLRAGDRDNALRLFRDNVELLETRFHDDYTDPDPLLAETLWMFAALSEASGDEPAARTLRKRAAEWAPGSVWARRAEL